jgi:uncharacterized protein YcaQ
MRSLTWREVWTRRLTRHGLLAPRPKEDLIEVVRAICGIHAQVMPAAELSIGVRLASGTRQDVREALWQRRGLVKMHGLRGTVHLFPADEFSLWLAAFRANPQPNEAQWLAQMGLEVAQRDAIAAAIGEALDGQHLTREDLGREVARRVGPWASEAVSPAFGGKWPRWQMAIGGAFTAGLLCFGPHEGNKVTFVRPDQWLGGWAEMDGEAALREVFRRYLSAYGPATHRDFAQWFGMPPSQAQAVMRDLAGELEEVDVEGHQAWLLQSDAAEGFPLAPDVVRLLPHFDCYLLGCYPRERLVPAAWSKRVLTRGAIGNLPLLVIDGIVAGVWKQQRAGKRIEIRVEAFEPLTPRQQRELEAAAARLGAIMDVDITLALGAIEARPHL